MFILLGAGGGLAPLARDIGSATNTMRISPVLQLIHLHTSNNIWYLNNEVFMKFHNTGELDPLPPKLRVI